MYDEPPGNSNWRAHWRLIFDVIDGAMRMQREITVWEKPARLGTGMIRFACDIRTLPTVAQVGVTVEADRVVFDNGYLAYEADLDTDIRDLVTSAGLAGGELEGLSVPVSDQNIYIKADIALLGTVAGGEYPIFFFPQDDTAGVRLVEAYDAGDDARRVRWVISNQRYLTRALFRLEGYEKRHSVRVRQGREDDLDLFDLFADSILLDTRTTVASHFFPAGMQTFYIGRTPDHPDGLTGAVYHLEFDPNNSCPTCPRIPPAGRDN